MRGLAVKTSSWSMLLGAPGLKFHGRLSVDSQVHAMAEVGLWRGVKGLTPIAFVLEKRDLCSEASDVVFPTYFLCAERIFIFSET